MPPANPARFTLNAVPSGERVLDQGEEGPVLVLMPLDEVLEAPEADLLGQCMHVAAVMLATRMLARL